MKINFKKSSFKPIAFLFGICMVLFCPNLVFGVGLETVNGTAINCSNPIIYAFFTILSLALLIGYCLLKKKKYLWMLMMLVAVFVINVGYMSLSVSHDVYEALLACRISYFGNAFMPLFLLLTLIDICQVDIKRAYKCVFLAITVVMVGFTLTAGYLPYFYKSVDYQVIEGHVTLIKEYGFLHTIYGAYIYLYYIFSGMIVLYSIIKKKIHFFRYVVMVIAVTTTNLIVWMLERFINSSFEFLSVSYVFMTIMLMVLYSEMEESGFLNCFQVVSDIYTEKQEALDLENDVLNDIEITIKDDVLNDVDVTMKEDETNELMKKLYDNFLKDDFLTKREIEVLFYLMEGNRRKKIAEKMFITENTVKTYVTRLYRKFEVNKSSELRTKVDEMI